MKQIIKFLTILSLYSSILYANISINSIGFVLGKSYMDFNKENHNSTINLNKSPNKNFNSIEIFTSINGVINYKNIKPYFSYSYNKNNDLEHQYILGGINYYFKNKKNYQIYTGLLAGLGKVKWEYDPLNISIDNKYEARSTIFGIQLGSKHSINKNIALGFNFKHLFHDYKTNLIPDENINNTINQKTSQFLGLTLEYNF